LPRPWASAPAHRPASSRAPGVSPAESWNRPLTRDIRYPHVLPLRVLMTPHLCRNAKAAPATRVSHERTATIIAKRTGKHHTCRVSSLPPRERPMAMLCRPCSLSCSRSFTPTRRNTNLSNTNQWVESSLFPLTPCGIKVEGAR
jgi:hypothetical protein